MALVRSDIVGGSGQVHQQQQQQQHPSQQTHPNVVEVLHHQHVQDQNPLVTTAYLQMNPEEHATSHNHQTRSSVLRLGMALLTIYITAALLVVALSYLVMGILVFTGETGSKSLGGGGGNAQQSQDIGITPEFRRFESCEALSQSLNSGSGISSSLIWWNPWPIEDETGCFDYSNSTITPIFFEVAADDTPAPQQSQTSSEAADFSTTNVQVEGVDEADIVKTDGRLIYALVNNASRVENQFIWWSRPRDCTRSLVIASSLATEDDESLHVISHTDLSQYDFHARDMYLFNNRLILIGTSTAMRTNVRVNANAGGAGGLIGPQFPSFVMNQITTIQIWDIHDVENSGQIHLLRTIKLEGSYLESRLVTETGSFYVVVQTRRFGPSPVVFEPPPPPGAIEMFPDSQSQTAEQQQQQLGTPPLIFDSSAQSDEWMPITACTNIAYIVGYPTTSLVTVGGLSLNEGDEHMPLLTETIALSGSKVYSSARNLYIAAEQYGAMAREPSTVIARFSLLQGGVPKVGFEGLFQVPGTLINQFSMDETAEDDRLYLKVATTRSGQWDPVTGSTGLSTNNLYIFDALQFTRISSLEGLAKGERIYAVRFWFDRVYLVTFRQTDPLFVIDVSNLESPRVLGELHIPGFSEYLHPWNESLVIGVGRQTTEQGTGVVIQGVKVSLFDVSNVAQPMELRKVIIGERGSTSEVLEDHKAFTTIRQRGWFVIPIKATRITDTCEIPGSCIFQEGRPQFQGAYVFSVNNHDNPESGVLSPMARITHMDDDTFALFDPQELEAAGPWQLNRIWDVSGDKVRRSLWIGDVLYTVSNNKIVASSMDGFAVLDSTQISNP